MGDSVQIEVMGQKYNLKGSYDREYIQRVENYVNKKIDEVKKSGGSISTHNMMVLVALNLVDECLKKDEELHRLTDMIEHNSHQLINLIDSHV